jgi:hypothetical protein
MAGVENYFIFSLEFCDIEANGHERSVKDLNTPYFTIVHIY